MSLILKLLSNKIVWIILIAIVSISIISIQRNTIKNRTTERDVAQTNIQMYTNEASLLKKETTGLKLTVDQLNHFNDSIIVKMNNLRKELKIKDKQIQNLQYYHEIITVTDTFNFKDTIFEPTFKGIDTIVGDKYYTNHLILKYPNIVITKPSFINEKYILVSDKKEFVNDRCWFFVCRWFQKKQIVLTIDVVDTNPYINTDKKRFIEILK